MFKGIREFITYTKGQRRGLYALLCLVLVLTVGLYFDDLFYHHAPSDFTEFRQLISQREAMAAERDSLALASFTTFDPNNTTVDFLVKTGLEKKVAQRVVNYTSKGGRFYQPSAMLKIYGMDSIWYQKAAPYINIKQEQKAEKKDWKPTYNFREFDPNLVEKHQLEEMGLYDWQAKNILTFRQKVRSFEKPGDIAEVYGIDSALAEKMQPFVKIDTSRIETEKKTPEKVIVNINTADSVELLKVKGIGPYTAMQVLKQRSRLGGFHSTGQLQGIYPIDSVRYKELRPQLICEGPIEILDVNAATFKELLNHPYLNYEVVKNIVSFREDIRPFKSVEELQHIELVDEVLFSKIAPYLHAGKPVQSDKTK